MEPLEEKEFSTETPFVGRKACLNKLNNAWNKHIIGLYGLRAIGKSRTIRTFLKQKIRKKDDDECLKGFSELRRSSLT